VAQQVQQQQTSRLMGKQEAVEVLEEQTRQGLEVLEEMVDSPVEEVAVEEQGQRMEGTVPQEEMVSSF
jgi:hypothetical protein